MLRVLAGIILSLSCLPAQPLARGERDFAMSHLHATRKQVLDAAEGLTEAQWRFKPSPQSWSLADLVEHLALTEDLLWEMLPTTILRAPAQPEKRSSDRERDQRILDLVAERSRKVEAPAPLRPARRWVTPREAVEHFRQSRDRTIAYLDKTEDPLRNHFAPHPALGEIDAYQWVLTLAAHTERHLAQMAEVKSHPGFPN